MLSAAAHSVGSPIPRGGSQRIADALAAAFTALGGTIETGRMIHSLEELPKSRAVLLDITPRQLVHIARAILPESYRRRMEDHRYGPGVFKMDWALDGPIPWKAAECLMAGTVHLGGTMGEIIAAENAAWEGRPIERPFVILAQPSLFDPSRAPPGKHTAWAFCSASMPPGGGVHGMCGYHAARAAMERFR